MINAQISIPKFWSSLRYRLREITWAKALRARLRRPKAASQFERNIWYLYVEIFWAAVFMAAMAFNATYALRLGASNAMVGWLSSFPALFAMVTMMPAARFLETKSDRAPWLKWSLFAGRGAFALVALVPWVIQRHQAEVVIWILILRAIPMNFFSAGFTPLLADILPERDRARVMANRNIIHSAALALCTLVFGKWLDFAAGRAWAGFPLNYQGVYIVGAVAALLSTYYVSKIEVPETKVIARPARSKKEKVSWAKLRSTLKDIVRENRAFARITVNTLVFNLGAWLVMSLYIILFVKELQASDGWIGLNTTLAHVGVILGHILWRRIIARVGNERALLLSVIPAASYAFLVALFPNLTLVLVWGVLINLVNPGVNLSHFSLLVELCPEDRRASYLALFTSVMNLGAFVAPMLGVALADAITIRWVLIIGGTLRLLGALMFFGWRVDIEAA